MPSRSLDLSQSKQIGECTFSVVPVKATVGTRVLIRLSKKLGPALGALSGQGLSMDVGDAAQYLANNLDENDINSLLKDLCYNAQYEHADGRPQPLNEQARDSVFRGKYMLLLQFIWFLLEVNFSDFLESIKGFIIDPQVAERAKLSPSPKA